MDCNGPVSEWGHDKLHLDAPYFAFLQTSLEDNSVGDPDEEEEWNRRLDAAIQSILPQPNGMKNKLVEIR